jgi:hypothetical protein
MATTTNYSWTTPDDTALVKDGAAAIRTLGSSVDTTVKALNPETTLGDIAYRSSTANVKTRLGLGTAGQVLTVNSGATAPEWATSAAGGMTLISTTTLSGTSITLSSIPSTYVHLQLIVRDYLPSSDYMVLKLRFNGDSASRYTTGSSTFFNSVGDALLGFTSSELYASSSNDNAVADGLSIINVFDYTNTVSRKLMEVLSIGTDGGTTTSSRYTGLLGGYNQTGAISSVTLFVDGGTFTSGTVLLYGVK